MTSLIPNLTLAPILLDVAWPARREDADAIAQRVARMFENLSRCDARVRRWYEVGSTPAEAAVPLPLAPSSLARRLAGSRLPPTEEEPEADQGFDLVAWNGEQEAAHASLVIQAGSDRSGLEWGNDMTNHVGICFEPAEPANAALLTAEVLKSVLLALIDAWEPMTGNVRPLKLIDSWAGDPPMIEQLRCHGGWITYVAAPECDEIAPPPGAIVEQTPDGGLLMLATPNTVDAADPAQLEAALAIHLALEPLWQPMDLPDF
ncbi:MAG TPA: Imm52 family immunity protein [Aliidongia sp.]|uniref:Imm52 family immunity protein n=1 Tax=Aliidongia sp. TaxID=1914230 RepID=UPI002DDD0716|nr:Imm52 family immunity protein [Aliidongia sp.]HEV2676845.1 Imm52 family immunity protein [Aliidongia sp.]